MEGVLDAELAIRLHGDDWRVYQARSVSETLTAPSNHGWVAEADGPTMALVVAAIADPDRRIGEIAMLATYHSRSLLTWMQVIFGLRRVGCWHQRRARSGPSRPREALVGALVCGSGRRPHVRLIAPSPGNISRQILRNTDRLASPESRGDRGTHISRRPAGRAWQGVAVC
jgi:hypothetical protein